MECYATHWFLCRSVRNCRKILSLVPSFLPPYSLPIAVYNGAAEEHGEEDEEGEEEEEEEEEGGEGGGGVGSRGARSNERFLLGRRYRRGRVGLV